MIQIVDQSAGAFDSAEKNMRRIRLQANVMFGKNGRVSLTMYSVGFDCFISDTADMPCRDH